MGFLEIVGWLLLGVALGRMSKRSAPRRPLDADPEYLRDLVSHYRAELDDAVEVNELLLEQRDAARSALNAAVECQIDYLERLELAEGGRHAVE